MKITKKATTIAEAIVVTLIITIGLSGVYLLYSNSIRFIDGVEKKIQAIQIAREGIEAMENIRQTNWSTLSSNTEQCWNSFNYGTGCVTSDSNAEYIGSGSYKVYRDDDNRWILEEGTSNLTNYSDSTYQGFYKVMLDADGFYTQTGSLTTATPPGSNTLVSTGSLFTRRIEVVTPVTLTKLDTSSPSPIEDVGSSSGMIVKSIVEWRDRSKNGVRKVELENLFTNYK